jgi:transcription-repair coupling factor (superfamily II helicase)
MEDRFGPVPEPVENLLSLARARIKLGAAGARAVSVRGGRLRVAPIELDSAGVRELRERVPEAIYESGRSQVVVRVAEEAKARFVDILAAADGVLAATGARG